ncbi:hypothetical protein GQR58_016789 [Nymphon striatum]|nr:hypothetical protein GQR58_016789 [Nymphon striatum]
MNDECGTKRWMEISSIHTYHDEDVNEEPNTEEIQLNVRFGIMDYKHVVTVVSRNNIEICLEEHKARTGSCAQSGDTAWSAGMETPVKTLKFISSCRIWISCTSCLKPFIQLYMRIRSLVIRAIIWWLVSSGSALCRLLVQVASGISSAIVWSPGSVFTVFTLGLNQSWIEGLLDSAVFLLKLLIFLGAIAAVIVLIVKVKIFPTWDVKRERRCQSSVCSNEENRIRCHQRFPLYLSDITERPLLPLLLIIKKILKRLSHADASPLQLHSLFHHIEIVMELARERFRNSCDEYTNLQQNSVTSSN